MLFLVALSLFNFELKDFLGKESLCQMEFLDESGEDHLEKTALENFDNDSIHLSLENVWSALSEQEFDEAVSLIESLLEVHSSEAIEGKPLTIYLAKTLERESSELKRYWTNRWRSEVEELKTKSAVPEHFLLKIMFHPEKKSFFKRFVFLLKESSDLYQTAESLLLADHLKLETGEMYQLYVQLLERLEKGPQLTWALEGWRESLLKEGDKSRLSEKWNRDLVLETTQVAESVDRPSSQTQWKTSIALEKKLSRRKEQAYRYKLLDHPQTQFGLSKNQFKFLSEKVDGSMGLYSLDIKTGKVLWDCSFESPEGGEFQCHYSAESQSFQVDAVAWHVPARSAQQQILGNQNVEQQFLVHLVTHNLKGQKLWTGQLSDYVNEAQSRSLAGQPIGMKGKVYLPLIDFSQVGLNGGPAFLSLLALDGKTGNYLWLKEIGELSYKGQMVLKNPLSLIAYKNSLLIFTGEQSLVSIDSENGQFLWQKNLESWYERVGVKRQEDHMNWNVARMRGNRDGWQAERGFFHTRGSLGCIKEKHSKVVFMFDLNSGQLIRDFDFSESESPKFICWDEEGLLLATQSQFVQFNRLLSQKIERKTWNVHFPKPIKSVLPRGRGVLMNTQAGIFEIFLDKKKEGIVFEKVADCSEEQKIALVSNQVIRYTKTEIESLKLYPSSFVAAQDLWRRGQKEEYLAKVILDELKGRDWDEFKKFVSNIPAELHQRKRISNWFVRLLLELIQKKELDRVEELLESLVGVSQHPAIGIISDQLNGITTEPREGVISLSEDYHLAVPTFNRLLSKRLGQFVGKEMEDAGKGLQENARRLCLDVHVNDKAIEEIPLNNWLLLKNSGQLLNKSTGKTLNLPGAYMTSNKDYLLVLKESLGLIYRVPSSGLGAPLWTLDTKEYQIDLSQFQKLSKNDKSSQQLALTNWNAGLQAVQTRQSADAFVEFRIVENNLIARVGKELICWQLNDGSFLWKKKIFQDLSLKDSLEDGSYLFLVNSKRDQLVYFHKMDTRTGDSDWILSISAKMSVDQNRWVHNASWMRNKDILAEDDSIYIFAAERWVIVDKNTGNHRLIDIQLPEEDIKNQRARTGIKSPFRVYHVFGKENFLMMGQPYLTGFSTLNYWYKKDGTLLKKRALRRAFSKKDEERAYAFDYQKKTLELWDSQKTEVIQSSKLPLTGSVSAFKCLGEHIYLASREGRSYKAYRFDMSEMSYEELELEGDKIENCFFGENFYVIQGNKKSRVFSYNNGS